jgi:uncharacterized protein YukE
MTAPLDAQDVDFLYTASGKAHVVAGDIMGTLQKFNGYVSQIEGAWVGSAPIVFRQIQERLSTRFTQSAEEMKQIGDQVKAAVDHYKASQDQAHQAVASADR